MTKEDIAKKIEEKLPGIKKKDAKEFVEIVIETMKESLAKGEDVKLSGFGAFKTKYKRERQGRNPQTGDQIKITQRTVVLFKPSPVLKKKMNG